MTTHREQVVQSLANKEYRDLYVEEHINQGIAFQIRAMRESRRLTQTDLAKLAHKQQPAISKLEDPDYGGYTLRTLKDIASAFDVALVVRFVPFSELVDWTVGLRPDRLAPPSFADDESLRSHSMWLSSSQSNVVESGSASTDDSLNVLYLQDYIASRYDWDDTTDNEGLA